MKLDVLAPEQTIEKSDDFDSIEYTIAEGQGHLLFKILSQYSNPIGSLIRETVTNAFDSHIEAGVTDNISVRIVTKSLSNSSSCFEVEDYGTGLSKDRVKEVYSKFLASTKRGSNEQHGAFGLGSKSPLSYCDMFYVVTRFNGTEYTYVISKGVKTPEINLIDTVDTYERNGTKIQVPIQLGDSYKFSEEINRQLKYFDNITYKNCGDNKFVIYQGNHFIYRESEKKQHNEYMHIVLGKVYYPIDFSALGLYSYKYNFPLGLKFEIGDLPIVWNRENIEYTEEAKSVILDKIRLAKEEIKNLWDTKYGNVDTIADYVNTKYLQKNKSIQLADGVFMRIDDFIEKSLTFKRYEDQGIKIPPNPLFMYRIHKNVVNGLVSKSKYTPELPSILGKNETDKLYYSDKKYSLIKNKYIARNDKEFYIVKRISNEPLDNINPDHYYSFDVDKRTPNSLMLHIQNKAIIEFQKEVHDYIKSICKDYDDIKPSKEFKEQMKSLSSKNLSNNEEVSYKKLKWSSHHDSCIEWFRCSDKISNLSKSAHNIIYGTREDEELMKLIFLMTFPKQRVFDIIKVSQTLYKELAYQDKFCSVHEFLYRNKRVIKRFVNAYNLKINYGTSSYNRILTKHFLYDSIDEDIRKIQKDIESITRNYINIDNMPFDDLELIKSYIKSNEDLIDQELVQNVKYVLDYYSRYKLITYLSLYNAYIPKDDRIHVDEYMNTKSEVSEILRSKLNIKKTKEDNDA